MAASCFRYGIGAVSSGLLALKAPGKGSIPTARSMRPEPPVDGLTGHLEPVDHLDDRNTIADDREDCLVPLLHDTQLHQHGRECVTDQAEPV